MIDSKLPLVSIVIPVYNGENYLNRLFDSIKRLNYMNREVIFINDGSSDNTLELLKAAEEEDNTISIISQENSGVSAARNVGLKMAKGEYICFIDVDDVIVYDYIEIFIDKMIDNGVDVAFCDSTKGIQNFDRNNIEVRQYKKEILLEDFLYGRVKTGIWGMCVSKEIFEKHKLFFKEGYAYSEDLHMVWRIFNSTNCAIHIKAPMYVYNDSQDSAMTKINEKRFDSIRLMRDLEEYFSFYNKEFYLLFKKYGVARVSWALLWQTAHYLNYDDFLSYITGYDFSTELKKLISYKDLRVKFSSIIFLISKRAYYCLVKLAARKYRINTG